MGTGFSSRRAQLDVKKNPDCSECWKCQHKPTNRPTAANNERVPVSDTDISNSTRVIKYINNGSVQSSSPTHSGQSTKFYFYPKRREKRNPHETIFVTTSQFPYTRPKAVVVRPRPIDINNQQAQVSNTVPKKEDVNNVHSKKFLMYNEEFPSPPYGTSGQNKPYQFVNERRWSNPNVMPTDSHQSNTVLPHKTVLELRSSNQVQPYGRHFSYVCDMDPSMPDSEYGRIRPPTPATNIWYPTRRTSDFLVASSLLAVEQTRERQKTNNRDIHDF